MALGGDKHKRTNGCLQWFLFCSTQEKPTECSQGIKQLTLCENQENIAQQVEYSMPEIEHVVLCWIRMLREHKDISKPFWS